jgi:uncharacterized protein (DUF2237 family)
MSLCYRRVPRADRWCVVAFPARVLRMVLPQRGWLLCTLGWQDYVGQGLAETVYQRIIMVGSVR